MNARSAFLMVFVVMVTSQGMTQEFRVETDVFVNDEPQPVAETLTLFRGDVVYDFILTEPREITVFDVKRNRIILLDPKREVQSTLKTDELVQFTAAIRAKAISNPEKPLFDIKFSSSIDPETGEHVLESSNLTYRAVGSVPENTTAIRRYHEFADWSARLNSAKPGNPPPFARLELNRKMADSGVIPVEITRTLKLPGRLRTKTRTANSRQAFTWKLSTTDRKRIDDTGTFMATFESVTLTKFWGFTGSGGDFQSPEE